LLKKDWLRHYKLPPRSTVKRVAVGDHPGHTPHGLPRQSQYPGD